MNLFVYFLFGSISLAGTTILGHVYVIEIALLLTIFAIPFLSGGAETNKRFVALDVFVPIYALFNLIAVMVGSQFLYESTRYYRANVMTPVIIYFVFRFLPVPMETIKKGLYVLASVASVQSIYYVQYYFVHSGRPHDIEGAITSTITLSFLFGMAICILFYMRPTLLPKISKTLAILVVCLLIFALVVSATRAVILGLLVLMPFGSKIWKNQKIKKLFSTTLLITLCLYMGVILTGVTLRSDIHMGKEERREIAKSYKRLISAEFYLADMSGRLAFSSKIARQAMENPVLGTGSSSYSIGKKGGTSYFVASVHNTLVSALVVSGVPGLILLLILIGGTYHCLNNTSANSQTGVDLGTILYVLFTILILISITNDMTGNRATIFFFLMALSARLYSLGKRLPTGSQITGIH